MTTTPAPVRSFVDFQRRGPVLSPTLTLYGALVVVGLLDIYTTLTGLEMTGLREGNPLATGFVMHGFPVLLALKVLALMASAAMTAYLVRAGGERWAQVGLTAGLVVWLFAVVWNSVHIMGGA